MVSKIVKPAPGRRVRNPLNGEVVPPEGILQPLNSFWRRRISDGDVVVEDPKVHKTIIEK